MTENSAIDRKIKSPKGDEHPKANKTKLIVAASIGNFLEVFDFTVYSFFAIIIGNLFFAAEDPLVSLLISVSVFGVGFIMRPLGSVIIGSYADTHGRKAALVLTIGLMALGSALIGFAPTYAQIGIYAPTLIIIGRLLQGFSTGGEIGTASTLLLESATHKSRGFFVSWNFVGQNLASLCGASLAAFLYYILPTEALYSWGWRLPFVLSLLIIPVGLYIRSNVEETHEPVDTKKAGYEAPFKRLVRDHWRHVILGILIVFPATAVTYTFIYYTPNYLKLISDIGSTQAFLISSYASVVGLIFAVFAGMIFDRVKRPAGIMIGALVLVFFSSFLTFYFVYNMTVFLFFFTICVACLGMLMTTSSMLILTHFHKSIRATATSVIYSTGVAIFGGTAQIIITQLMIMSNNNIMAPFWYLAVSVIVGIIATILFRHHDKEV